MWTVVYMSDKSTALAEICALLASSGVLYRVCPINGQDSCCEVLVPAAEVKEAHELILNKEL